MVLMGRVHWSVIYEHSGMIPSLHGRHKSIAGQAEKQPTVCTCKCSAGFAGRGSSEHHKVITCKQPCEHLCVKVQPLLRFPFQQLHLPLQLSKGAALGRSLAGQAPWLWLLEGLLQAPPSHGFYPGRQPPATGPTD